MVNNFMPIIERSVEKCSIKFVLALSLLVFFYIFNIKFNVLSWMPTQRAIFLVLVLCYGIKTVIFFKKEISQYPIYFFCLSSVFLYVFLQTLLNGTSDIGMLSPMIVFTLFSLFIAAVFSHLFPSINSFLIAVGLACLCQAIMVYISFFSIEYRYWLSDLVIESGSIPIITGGRAPGFSTGSGSNLSLQLSFGAFALMSIYYLSNRLKVKAICFISSFIIMTSCVLVGKLGLFLSFYFIFIVVLFDALKSIKRLLKFITFLIVSIALLVNLNFIGSEGQLSYAIERSFSLFITGDDSSITALKNMPIPQLSLETTIGHGTINGENGENASGSDMGYIQTYYGIGLIFAILFYLPLFLYLVKNIFKIQDKSLRILASILFIPLFIVEFKEPFITKMTFMLVLFSFVFISRNKVRYFSMKRQPTP